MCGVFESTSIGLTSRGTRDVPVPLLPRRRDSSTSHPHKSLIFLSWTSRISLHLNVTSQEPPLPVQVEVARPDTDKRTCHWVSLTWVSSQIPYSIPRNVLPHRKFVSELSSFLNQSLSVAPVFSLSLSPLFPSLFMCRSPKVL